MSDLDLFSDGIESIAWDPINTAAHYARNKMSIIDLIDKKPWRHDWPELATSNISDVVQMFEQTIHRARSVDRVRVGWALGRDGLMALDIDTPDLVGPELQAVLDGGGYATNPTSKPEKFHAIFAMPAGIVVGNSTSRFPTKGWGEVRGFGGQICIAGPDRPGFDITELPKIRPFPRPEWPTPYEESGTLASATEVAQFLAAYTESKAPRRLETILAYGADESWFAARHVRAMDALGWAMRDARIGLFPAVDAVDQLRAQFLGAVEGDDERRRLYPHPEREFEILVSRAVGLANEMTDLDVFNRTWDAIEHGTIPLPMNGATRQPAALIDIYQSAGALTGRRRVTLTSASTIRVRPVKWLWLDRIALGTLALIGGREGIGKSLLTYQFVADITRGVLPGINFGVPRSVIVCATEDSWEHTIVPRLMAAGADLDRVFRIDVTTSEGVAGTLTLPTDMIALEAAISEVAAVAIVLDPLMSRLDGDLDTHKDAEVRIALEPLVALADRTNTSVLGLIHVNKSTTTDPLTMLMASRAFAAVARAVLFVTVDPDDQSGRQRFLGQPKNNLGTLDLPMLVFTIDSKQVAVTDEGPVWTGRIVWQGEDPRSIADVLRSTPAIEPSATMECEKWLTDYLTIHDVASSKVIKSEAKAAGHSERTVVRARERIGAGLNDHGFPRTSWWSRPGMTPDEVTDWFKKQATP